MGSILNDTRRLIFTVTSGRSGTALLAKLLSRVPGVVALHEPEPRFNFKLRETIADPRRAIPFLLEEKLPAIAKLNGETYVETSHLICKGFIEPLLALGLKPEFVILRRDPVQVARSLFQMNVIPGRTFDGLLVLLQPSDKGVLPLISWEAMSDYQLCFWYALEIERRQLHYEDLFARCGIMFYSVSMNDLTDRGQFGQVLARMFPQKGLRIEEAEFTEIISVNQNPKEKAAPGRPLRLLPEMPQDEEAEVYELIRFYEPDLQRRIERAYK